MARATLRPIAQEDLEPARRLLREMSPQLREIGKDWYHLVNDRICCWAHDTGYSREQVAAVIALYSINQGWKGNMTLARKALFEGQVRGLGRVTCRVRRILAAECSEPEYWLTPSSKVRNFYHSLLLEDSCTLDRWMFRIFGKRQGEDWYGWVERAVRILALEEGTEAYEMQSMLWMAIVARERGTVRHHMA